MSQAAPFRAVRVSAVACAGLACIAVVVAAAAFQQPAAGGAFAVGVLLGTLNGAAAARLVNLPVPFLATSLMRLVTLSLVGIAIGLAFGLPRIWLVILGLGFAQLALAAAALREGLRA
ncbi:MAG TPA: hypothetical protein VFA70_00855 [Dehalococcoidia bacterium]|nr:hypothetical protein [Dehalococcoidia bacterium]